MHRPSPKDRKGGGRRDRVNKRVQREREEGAWGLDLELLEQPDVLLLHLLERLGSALHVGHESLSLLLLGRQLPAAERYTVWPEILARIFGRFVIFPFFLKIGGF